MIPEPAPSLPDWYVAGLEDDMRPRMFAAAGAGEAFALATVTAADGGGPRGPGSQMVITARDVAGFVSGGCIESDVALHARDVLAAGAPTRLVYGRGSPFVDTRLPCGGRLELLVEAFAPGDPVIADLKVAAENRRAVTLASDGRERVLLDGDAPHPQRLRVYLPRPRLIVIGADGFALAIADQGLRQSWEVVLVRPQGPEAHPPLAVGYLREKPANALDQLGLDSWTAVAIATHDADLDHEALATALPSPAAYVGVLGSRRRLPERLDRLRRAGVRPGALSRLHAPIGLDIGARSPQEVAAAVIAQIIAARP